MAKKAFIRSFFTMLILFAAFIWFFSHHGALPGSAKWFPDMDKAVVKKEQSAKDWFIQQEDGTKWGYQ